MSISNIYLMRCHVRNKPTQPKAVESQIPVNSSQPDSQRMRPQGMPDKNVMIDPHGNRVNEPSVK